MRWNPFRRAAQADATDSQFESTVVEDGARSVGPDSALRPSGSPGANAEAASIGHIGRYALKAVLGEGGLGTVYAAWDPLLSRTVAVKTLHLDADAASRTSLDALFLNEARAAAGLSHPHIVTVFDAGPAETGVYIAMERLLGQDLRHLLHQGFRPNPVEAAQIVRRVADALAYAHRKGVIHCDIKPANIFMVGRMHPKVLDFGIARVAHREAVPALEGMVAGSPYYLPPEQLDGRTVDRRSDVYSLGVVFHELLTGQKPFDGRNLDEIAKAVKTADAPQAHTVSPRVPPGLSAIAARAMARNPEERYPSARHLAMELRHWLDSSEGRAIARSQGGTGTGRPGAGTAAVVAAVLAVLVGALLVWRAWISPDAEPALTEALPRVAPGGAARTGTAAPTPPTANSIAPGVAAPPSPPGTLPAVVAGGSAPVAGARDLARESGPDGARKEAKGDAARGKRKVAASAAPVPEPPPPPAAVPGPGTVQFAVTPWGQVEVNGQAMGTTPPLTKLTLNPGNYKITVRNADFPDFVTNVTVDADHPVVVRYRFGQ